MLHRFCLRVRGCGAMRRSIVVSFSLLPGLLLAVPRGASAQNAAIATTTTISFQSNGASVASVNAGTAVTLQATVKAANNTQAAPGQVIFCDASNDTAARGVMADCVVPIAAAQTISHPAQTNNGAVNYSQASVTIYPAAGNRRYEAVFLGNSHYTISASEAELTVAGAATSTSLAASGSSPNYTLAATVSTSGPNAATGTVSFRDTTTGADLGSASLGAASTANSLTIASQPNSGDTGPCGIASGDFNNDGIADFAIAVGGCGGPLQANPAYGLLILLGKDDGSFTETQLFPGVNVTAVAASDFNNDGFVDLVVATDSESYEGSGSYALYFLAGNGTGTFTQSSAGTPCQVVSMVAADFNGDGNLDLAASCGDTSSTQIYLGNGKGSFTAGASFASYAGNPYALGTADFNGDGFADLAALDAGGNAVVYLNDGTGKFSAGTSFGQADGLQVGDFNGDGHADVVLINENYEPSGDTATLTLEPGMGDGTFASPVTTSFPVPDVGADVGFPMVAADFNGDGITDLGVIGSDHAYLALGTSSGNFDIAASVPIQDTGVANYYPGAIGDFNGDGIPDMLIASGDLTTAYAVAVEQTNAQTASLSSVSPAGSGSHSITATYNGGATTAASTSSAVSLTAASVNTSLVLTATPADIAFGSQVALQAALTPYSSGNLSTDGEQIAFRSGGQSLGTAQLETGVAVLNIASLPAGTDSIAASYAGDSNFAGSSAPAVTVTVAAAVPAASLSPGSLTFSQQAAGTASSAQTVTLSNTGQGALTIASIAASGDFAETNTCGSSVAAGATCSISVTFTPAAAGIRTGMLTIADNAGDSPQTVALTGSGYTVAVSSTSSSLTVTPGKSASANIQISSDNLTGSVSLACSVAYQGTGAANQPPTCSLNPAQIQVTPGTPGSSTLTVDTTGSSARLGNDLQLFHRGAETALACALLFFAVPRRKRRTMVLLVLVGMVSLGSAIGCGGSSSGKSGTTPGSYSVTVTATSGSATVTLKFPLSVQ